MLDVEFEPEHLPEIYNALLIEDATGAVPVRLVAEVQQHIGQNQVRAVAMSSTDGVVRGMKVADTGGPITVPVGDVALGRILNVLGEPVDGGAADPGGDAALADPPRDARSSPTSSPRPRSSRPASRSST